MEVDAREAAEVLHPSPEVTEYLQPYPLPFKTVPTAAILPSAV